MPVLSRLLLFAVMLYRISRSSTIFGAVIIICRESQDIGFSLFFFSFSVTYLHALLNCYQCDTLLAIETIYNCFASFIQEDVDDDMEDGEPQVDEKVIEHEVQAKDKKRSNKVITTSMVDLWCKSIKENGSLNAVRSLMRAFRTACHYGDDDENDSTAKLSVMSSVVFNKIMLTVLNEMDGILRKLLKLPASGGRKEIIMDLMTTKQWRTYGHIVKSYLGNALHILNQMTDSQMISFTLHRLKYSSLLLAAFPSLLRKYIKVQIVHWSPHHCSLQNS